MKISVTLFSCVLLPILASVVAVTFADPGITDNQLVQFMSCFMNVKYTLEGPLVEYFHKSIAQMFNHLNRLDGERWGQICWDTTYYNSSSQGPLIMVVGGLSKITKFDIQNPVLNEIAQRTEGMLIFIEQRFFGLSNPCEYSVAEFDILFNSEEALYDIINLMDYYNKLYPDKKWIIIGEGYGGKLAAWIRMKYPHAVEGAVAINAQLIPKLEFKEYFVNVNEQLSKYTGVMETIRDAYEIIAEDINQNRFDDLKNKLKLCTCVNNIHKNKNIRYMYWSITWNLGRITELKNTDQYKEKILKAFANTSQTDPVVRLKDALILILRRFHSRCIHVDYRQALEWLQKSDLIIDKKMDKTLLSGIGSRQKFWKVCTEYGQMKTSTKENMFGDVKLEFFFDLCKDVFGDWYDATILEKSIEKTNRFYGGKDIDATNILFINYENNQEKALTLSEEHVDRNLKVIDIPDVPDTPEGLTNSLRNTLTKKYNDIYNFISAISGRKILKQPNIEAERVPDKAFRKKKLEDETTANSTKKEELGVDSVGK